ncbi:retrovirus-related pol polyprotein from transposon TNT 1-94 [Tanacetum coccineum]
MIGDRSQLTNFRFSNFLGTSQFGNDHVRKDYGLGDYQIGNVYNSRVFTLTELGLSILHGTIFVIPTSKCAFSNTIASFTILRSVHGKEVHPVLLSTITLRIYLDILPLQSKDEAARFYYLFFKDDPCRLKENRSDASEQIMEMSLLIRTLALNYYEKVGISHETSVARSPQQNGVVERRNHTLIEAARTMLIYAKAPLFLWAKVVATACYTQNRSMIRLRHGKTPYELMHNKPPDLSYLHVFGALCYPTHDSDRTLGIVTKPKGQYSSGPALHEMTPATISSGLVPNPHPSTPFVPPSRTDWDMLFQPLFDEFLNPSPSVDHPALEVVAPEVISPVLADSTGSPSPTTVDKDAPSPIAHMLYEQALFCYYDAFLTAVEPKTYKDALTQACWIEAMQEELNEFE